MLQAGELRVCIWPDYYGVTYRNPKTRQLSGIDIDISAVLAQQLGVRLRYVDSNFAELVDKLLTDRCDIAMHAVGITPERQARLAITQPYLRSDMYAITAADNRWIAAWEDLDQPGRIIAVQAGTIMEKVMQRRLKQAKVLVVAAPMTRENEVASGRADAFITDYPYSRRMLELTDWARLVAPSQPFHPVDYGYALAPGDPSLLAEVNRFIDRIRADGRMRRFAARHRLGPIVIERR